MSHLFRVGNRHSADCGPPPPPVDAEADPDQYVGYFCGPHGDQWLYTYRHSTGAAEVRGGDAGWANAYPVAGRADGLATVSGLILNQPELAWVTACWLATGARRRADG